MKRLPSMIVGEMLVMLLVTLLAACAGSTGGLGTVPTPAPTVSADPAGPDLTATPSGSPATPSGQPSEAPGANATPSPASSPAGTTIVRAYFVLGGQPGSAGLVPVLREVPKTAQVATAAMDALLDGPAADEAAERTITSAVPAGTRLLGISIKNGLATVDLSTEFDSGGGSASMHDRLAQVVYTLTQFSTVKSVLFQVEGQTVTVFGSEGIALDGPVGRADYKDQLPAIFVDRPAYGAALGNPGRVSGNADVFEATFRVAILDAAGKSLLDQQVMATCGTGCRGTFDVMVSYTIARAQYGTLRVYEPSAKDGTPQNIRDYPVWLTPAS
jgi:spore germination protein GerM